MHAEIFDFVEWNGLIFRWFFIWWFVAFWISAECAQTHLASRYSAHWIDDNGHKWFLIVLIQHLCRHIDAGQPAAVARMAVIPTDGVFQAAFTNSKDTFSMKIKIFLLRRRCVHTNFRGRFNVCRHVFVGL